MSTRQVGRDELSRRLHDLRLAAGLSGMAAAEQIGSNQSKVSRVELGRTIPEPEFVEALCKAYGAEPDECRELVAMARDVKAANRRVVLRREVAGFQNQISRIEQQSAVVRAFSPTAIHSLLQTADYVRAVFRMASDLGAEAVEDGVRARLNKQAILADTTSARRFVILVPEGAFGWALLPSAQMAAQLAHLKAVSERPNVRIGIIPWGRPCPVLPLHSWSLYDQRAAIVTTTTATAVLNEPLDIARYAELTDELEKLAVYGEDARMILTLNEERYHRLSLG